MSVSGAQGLLLAWGLGDYSWKCPDDSAVSARDLTPGLPQAKHVLWAQRTNVA